MVVQNIRTKRKARRNRSRRNKLTNKKNNNRYKRTGNKNIRTKRSKRTLKRRKQSKKNMIKNVQAGGTIDKINSNLQFMLAMEKIEFLPSTSTLDKNYKHYLKMVDYITLQEMVNNNSELKVSKFQGH